ncbi:pectate lyase [Novipirellula artificiosorum]|uniref:Pectic acid lyase n=1 Tax=Novipirellula artificiosorum TaxID=2528016 RepID=A0A5C6D6U5_9BACT|nr:pectate lyase [Novipirellula artificiosorum]TWU32913.1 Pectic acid lyase [Novipirellula artificiosorum]
MYPSVLRQTLLALIMFGVLPNTLLLLCGQDSLTESQIKRSLHNATRFMAETVSDHGGYAWVSSADGVHSHGEGVAGQDRVWVQPPGTPAVGMAFLQAFRVTLDPVHLDAAKDVGDALVQGQLRSGGWGYSIEFDPTKRESIPYRVGPNGKTESIAETPQPGGWDVWKQRKYGENKTVLDDDTTAAAIRFFCQLDQTLEFKDAGIHDAVEYALRSCLSAQHPIGGWSHNYDRFPLEPPSERFYPIVRAGYPESWDRTWTKDFTGCYVLNDCISLDMIDAMLLAADVYDDPRYRQSALRGGEFLLLAQMPDPQPAWAQQYNRAMQPVWDRKFEPPAITGFESQRVMKTLMDLYQETKDQRFLDAVGPAIDYLKSCRREDGKLARYYELRTNQPIYFTVDYQMTHDDADMPDHYSFVVDSDLEQIELRYQRLVDGREPAAIGRPDGNQVAEVVGRQASSGAWLLPGYVRDAAGKKLVPTEGVVHSDEFIRNVDLLSRFLRP